ncbi:MAG: GNAT family N-acetyltransferase, partial [Cyanobacteriota bacterium]
RTMSKEDLNVAIDWAAQEGWNPGLYDLDAFFEADPNGYLIGELDNKPVATVSVVAYDNTFGFLGFYIVKEEFRGKGYGLKLWQEGLKYLGNRNIGLDGVIAQQENYKKSGFKFAYRNIRYEGIAENYDLRNTLELKYIAFNDLLKFDNKMFPVSRPAFLKQWIEQPESFARAVIIDNKLQGYGMLRKCRSGYKIGPLFAENNLIAEDLLIDLIRNIPGKKYYYDTPEVNAAAVSLAKKYNMNMVFETARMYTRQKPELPTDKIFGVTTFELG